jgi:hypothetical protein
MSMILIKYQGLNMALPEHTVRSIIYEELPGNEADVRVLRMGDLESFSLRGPEEQIKKVDERAVGASVSEVIQVTETQAVRRNEISSVNAYDAEPVLKFKDRLVVGTRTGERHLVEFDTREQRDAEAKRIIREWRGV